MDPVGNATSNPGISPSYQSNKISGKNINLLNGFVLEEGTILFNGKNWRIASGDYAVINGVEIVGGEIDPENPKTLAKKYAVDLFFDGKEHANSERYISLNVAQKRIVMGSKSKGEYFEFNPSVTATFRQNNPFIPMDITDVSEISVFSPDGNIALTIENRDRSGLIPKIKIKGDKSASAVIRNGWLRTTANVAGEIYITKRTVAVQSLTWESTGVPYEVVVNDPLNSSVLLKVRTEDGSRNGKFLEETVEGDRLILNNYDEVGVFNGNSYLPAPNFPPHPPAVSIHENQKKYALKDFNEAFPDIEFKGAASSRNVKIAMDYIHSLPKNYLEGLNSIRFVCELEFYRYFDNPDVRAVTYKGELRLNVSLLLARDFYHEMGHIVIEELLSAPRAWPTISWQGFSVEKSFKDQWLEISGDIYGKCLTKDNKGLLKWKYSQAEGATPWAGYGFVTLYSAKNWKEDVAEYISMIKTNPELFRLLFRKDTGNPESVWRHKLDLMLRFNLITPSEYNRVMITYPMQ